MSKFKVYSILGTLMGVSCSVSAETSSLLATKVYSLWIRSNGGLYAIAQDDDLAKTAYGSGFSIAGGLGFSRNALALGLGLGWARSRISLTTSPRYNEEISQTEKETPNGLISSYAYLDAALGYRLSTQFYLGGNLLVPLGSDSQFTIRTTANTPRPHPFAGLELKFSPAEEGTAADQPRWWYGINALRDVTIANRDVYQLLASISYDLPVYKSVERPLIVYRNRYKLREKVVLNIEDRHFIGLGVVNFPPAEAQIPADQRAYLEALAKFLAANPQRWRAIMLGNNQPNFDKEARQITQQRIAAIAEVLQRNGITAEQIKNYDLSKPESGETSVFDALEILDISLVGDRNIEEMKTEALHLMQRFAIPDTCEAGKCI
jgi:hypothetical protein